MDVDTSSGSYKRAKQRVEELRGFYSHLIIYLIVNFILFVVNALTSYGNWWFYWVLVFWGIGIFFHFIGVFILQGKILGREWEEKHIKSIIEKEEGPKKPEEK